MQGEMNEAGPAMAAALGDRVVGSLEGRGLIHHVDVGAVGEPGPSVVADRVAGVVLGLAAGNAVGRRDGGRVGAETQTFVTSCEAWLDHGWRAPEALAELFARRLPGLPVAGSGAAHRRRAAPPWRALARGGEPLVRQRRPVPGGRGRDRAGRRRSLDRRGGLASTPRSPTPHGGRRHRRRRWPGSSPRSCSAMRRPLPLIVVARVVASVGHDKVRASLELALASRGVPAADVVSRTGDWPHATSTLALALWCALEFADPAEAIATAGGDQRPRRHGRRRHRRPGRGDPRRLVTPGRLGRRRRRGERLPAARRPRGRAETRRPPVDPLDRGGDLVPARPFGLDGIDRRRRRHRVRSVLRRAARRGR